MARGTCPSARSMTMRDSAGVSLNRTKSISCAVRRFRLGSLTNTMARTGLFSSRSNRPMGDTSNCSEEPLRRDNASAPPDLKPTPDEVAVASATSAHRREVSSERSALSFRRIACSPSLVASKRSAARFIVIICPFAPRRITPMSRESNADCRPQARLRAAMSSECSL